MRLPIFNRSETNFYHNRLEEEAKGGGRANLCENSEPHGVDFSFACEQKLRSSFGYETYPAKWHKQGRELTVLLPVFGKTGSYWTCNLKTDVKDFAYTSHNGSMSSEPVAQYKEWMVKHEYDPEHGKEMPVRVQGVGGAGEQTVPAAPR